ncbi:hypothetical Protein psc5_04780 [Candidatus Phytoplasma solani]
MLNRRFELGMKKDSREESLGLMFTNYLIYQVFLGRAGI